MIGSRSLYLASDPLIQPPIALLPLHTVCSCLWAFAYLHSPAYNMSPKLHYVFTIIYLVRAEQWVVLSSQDTRGSLPPGNPRAEGRSWVEKDLR